ncbi:8eb8ab4f-52e1-439a-a3f6-3ee30a0ba3d3 [Sclerotinia trifoliorum]|uniref:8eb8ab4f-52e1-439a-a3f6-3ee30a0ba3d3 n=1 Tax=Sclerotinia trifoliorum TaxID=28548 RepID=A0A8H2VQU7_9HELO|nr:8eb8ab4f-52e1-439a-a3f6-3ee30a0ba3d3 [Sclerotinia trifoliorum]
MSTRTEKFQRKPRDPTSDLSEAAEAEEVLRFPPEEEASLLAESNTLKATANDLFSKKSYKGAIDTYESALSTCPKYLEYERAVLKSNVAACHLKLDEWKEAAKASSEALEGLERLQKKEAEEKDGDGDKGAKKEEVKEEEEADEEIISEGATKAEDTRGKDIDDAKETRAKDIERIKAKALMRRARARSEQDGWSTLAGAVEDYKLLSTFTNLSAVDRRTVQTQLRLLPPRSKAAQDREMGEMMGKLKQFGNGILSPFGLSTDNFQMVKDEKTGGYSMNFNQGGNS